MEEHPDPGAGGLDRHVNFSSDTSPASNESPFARWDAVRVLVEVEDKGHRYSEWQFGRVIKVRSDRLLDIKYESDGFKHMGVSKRSVEKVAEEHLCYDVSKTTVVVSGIKKTPNILSEKAKARKSTKTLARSKRKKSKDSKAAVDREKNLNKQREEKESRAETEPSQNESVAPTPESPSETTDDQKPSKKAEKKQSAKTRTNTAANPPKMLEKKMTPAELKCAEEIEILERCGEFVKSLPSKGLGRRSLPLKGLGRRARRRKSRRNSLRNSRRKSRRKSLRKSQADVPSEAATIAVPSEPAKNAVPQELVEIDAIGIEVSYVEQTRGVSREEEETAPGDAFYSLAFAPSLDWIVDKISNSTVNKWLMAACFVVLAFVYLHSAPSVAISSSPFFLILVALCSMSISRLIDDIHIPTIWLRLGALLRGHALNAGRRFLSINKYEFGMSCLLVFLWMMPVADATKPGSSSTPISAGPLAAGVARLGGAAVAGFFAGAPAQPIDRDENTSENGGDVGSTGDNENDTMNEERLTEEVKGMHH